MNDDAGTTHPPGTIGADRKFFDPARPGSLRDQQDLHDAEGDDVRQYTGEPVQTDDGWILPRQQNVGPGNEAGGGEFPDPGTPPVQPRDDRPDEAADPDRDRAGTRRGSDPGTAG